MTCQGEKIFLMVEQTSHSCFENKEEWYAADEFDRRMSFGIGCEQVEFKMCQIKKTEKPLHIRLTGKKGVRLLSIDIIDSTGNYIVTHFCLKCNKVEKKTVSRTQPFSPIVWSRCDKNTLQHGATTTRLDQKASLSPPC